MLTPKLIPHLLSLLSHSTGQTMGNLCLLTIRCSSIPWKRQREWRAFSRRNVRAFWLGVGKPNLLSVNPGHRRFCFNPATCRSWSNIDA